MDILKYWKIDQFEISSYKYCIKERVNNVYKTSGSDNTETCTYTYNELGFRGDSIYKKGFKILSLGCSLTEGVGVNDNETWPHQFSKLVEGSVDLNFGVGGRSNDFIVRCLLTYFDIILPDLVLIKYTFPHRREIYLDSGEIEPYIPAKSWGYLAETEDGKNIQKNLDELSNKNDDFINWYKNHLLIKYFLETKKCNWIWNGNRVKTDYTEENKFEDGIKVHLDYGADGVHPGPRHHKEYSKKLYGFIAKNFPSYIRLEKKLF